MNLVAMMLVAMALDLALGWPKALFRRIGHPVTWLGALIGALESRLNREGTNRRARGLLTALLVTGIAAGIGAAAQALLPEGWLGFVIGGALAWPLVALRSMHDHVMRVTKPLIAGDLTGARHAVAMIVGRDPKQLDTAGVARAALESLAENSSDGIVAPLFWGALLGLPGIAAYKAINTLDSMIGHRNARYEAFGWAAARIDDGANLLPARLTGVLFALASGGRAKDAFRVMLRDAKAHRSPNAGWPESALAGALGIRLSGPRHYGDRVAQEPWLNGAAPDPGAHDLARGLALFRRAMGLGAVLLVLVALAIWGM